MSPLSIFQASYSNHKKQGIVAVLSSDSEHSQIQPSSLRRTFSADMSSHKWISHMKKVASFQEFHNPKTEHETEGVDVWSSIIKESRQDFLASDAKFISDPYIHPLLKRSGKCLSEKSLEICTESLGSETGSDGFSSYPSSEDEDTDDDEENIFEGTRTFEVENQWKPVKISYKKSPPHRSFPPPLPTLSGPDGESLRMQPRRDNGRLVLEAMSMPSQNNFRAQRQEGRLVLTLLNRHPINPVEKNDDCEEKEEEEEEKKEQEMTKSSECPRGLLNTHRLASVMNSKTIALANRNPSLPPRPKAAQPIIGCAAPPAAASLNAYEYYWRSKPMGKTGTTMNPLRQQPPSFKSSSRKVIICKNRTANEEEKLVVMCSNGSCKEVRRTVVFWEPQCIATS